ncbi:MAG TPA: hypothetical protein PKD55_05770 [Bellilinea sp.]|nr:hypothetical protein [Bellilinea sp.]
MSVPLLTLEHLSYEMREQHKISRSWRKVAEPYGIFPDTARLIAKGYEPGKKIRERLGLPPAASVVVVYGVVPDGAQVLQAERCQCGQYFIPNHPRRRKCFMCSPYRKRKS